MLSHLFFVDDVVLFAEASLDQVSVIRNCLDRFFAISGQCVSFEKSKISFSSNVPLDLAEQSSNIAGIPITITTDMGVYHGVPTVHGIITKHTFSHLLDKVRARLAS